MNLACPACGSEGRELIEEPNAGFCANQDCRVLLYELMEGKK